MVKEFSFNSYDECPEEWRDIAGFEQKYQVSNKGKVRSLNFHREHKVQELKTYIDRYGYEKVVLNKNGKPYYFTVHRLVANAFIKNPDNKSSVDHIDCNPLNNEVSNLRWATNYENLLYSHKLGRQKHNATPVIATRDDGKVFKYDSQKQAARETGVCQWAISRTLSGKEVNLKGWRFEHDKRNCI